MKITIIYDNTAFRKDLAPDWGFAALIEAHGKRILFDTGQRGSILLTNMKKLGISPADIDAVFISHAHFDHTGGLSAFLDENSDVTVWSPQSFRGVRHAREVTYIKEPRKLYDGIYSTGQLEGIEQSLCLESTKGIVIVAGCSHPVMSHILAAASRYGTVYGIIGGLHGNRPETLKNLQLICATHCTQYQEEIRAMYPKQYVQGGAGTIIEIPE